MKCFYSLLLVLCISCVSGRDEFTPLGSTSIGEVQDQTDGNIADSTQKDEVISNDSCMLNDEIDIDFNNYNLSNEQIQLMRNGEGIPLEDVPWLINEDDFVLYSECVYVPSCGMPCYSCSGTSKCCRVSCSQCTSGCDEGTDNKKCTTPTPTRNCCPH